MRSPPRPSEQLNRPVVPPVLGIYDFNNSNIRRPDTSVFEAIRLDGVDNYVCPHRDVVLWAEERRRRYSSRNEGNYAINPLHQVEPHLWEIFHSQEFRNNQRRYNSLFSFTALAADGSQKRTWTNPAAPSMLTMHGRAYHRIFDLEERHDMMTVGNTARLYIYDSDFVGQ